jgi:NDP-sugar pyrophosphorylase family protein
VKALILAAGHGTRLGDLTRDRPKAMLPIGEEPLIAHTLRYLALHGFDQVAINLHFLPDLIVDHLGDGHRFGVSITYSREEALLGTAGSVKRLESFFAGEPDFLVIYGDLLIDQDLGQLLRFHRASAAAATLLLHQRPGSNSLVHREGDGRITAFVERPTEEERRHNPHPWVNSGVQVLGPRILQAIPASGACDLPRDVYIPLLARERICGFPLSGYRCAIDSSERLASAQRAFTDGHYRPR